MQFPAKDRVEWLADEGTFSEWDNELVAKDPLDFPGYQAKIDRSQKITRLEEAVLTRTS